MSSLAVSAARENTPTVTSRSPAEFGTSDPSGLRQGTGRLDPPAQRRPNRTHRPAGTQDVHGQPATSRKLSNRVSGDEREVWGGHLCRGNPNPRCVYQQLRLLCCWKNRG